jgi:hypothetical protein
MLGGRVSLCGFYELLEDFFVGFLGVRRLNLSFAVEILRETASSADISDDSFKELIRIVNSLLPSDPDFETAEIAGDRIFPVKFPSGEVQRVSRATYFFIPDRAPLRRLFERKLRFLDFSLEEVAQLRPFLSWTGMSPRYISMRVTEITSVQVGNEAVLCRAKRQLSCRANGFLRFAPFAPSLFFLSTF